MSKEICTLNGTKWILGNESTETMTWEEAKKWCKAINQDLPPREVLLMAFLNPEIRKKFSHDYYWSSSEDGTNYAWSQNFNNGYHYDLNKTTTCLVRAVRAISAEASEQNEQEPVPLTQTEAYKKGYWVAVNDLKAKIDNIFAGLGVE